MFKPLSLVVVLAATAYAADAVADPVLTPNEKLIVQTLRSQVFPGEIQVKNGGYQDLDNNMVGEYMFLSQLAGRTATSKLQLRGADTGLHMLTGPLASGLESHGYRFAVVLPGGAQGLIVEAEPLPVVPADGVADREKYFATIAWPTSKEAGTHAFLLMPDGGVRSASNDGTMPAASETITYDAAKKVWATTWTALSEKLVLASLAEKEPEGPSKF